MRPVVLCVLAAALLTSACATTQAPPAAAVATTAPAPQALAAPAQPAPAAVAAGFAALPGWADDDHAAGTTLCDQLRRSTIWFGHSGWVGLYDHVYLWHLPGRPLRLV